MKAMPLPFEEFQGKGVLDFSTASSDSLPHLHHLYQQQQLQKWHNTNKENCYVGTEPTSVLDTRRSPSPPTSTSTLSSSLGNGVASTTTTATAKAAATASENHHQPSSQTSLDIGEKCGLGMEDWEGVLSDSSSGQEQSILRLIMGDIEDPSLGLNKLLHQDLEFNSGFGMIDQAAGFGCLEMPNNLLPSIDPSAEFAFSGGGTNATRLGSVSTPNHSPMFSVATSNNLLPGSLSHSPAMFHHQQQQQQVQTIETVDEKPQIFNPQMTHPNQAQYAQNPALFMPLTYAQLQEHHLGSSPLAKRHNLGGIGPNYQVPKSPFLEPGQELLRRQQQQQQNQLQVLPQHIQQRPMMVSKQKMVCNELANQQQQQQQFLFDQLYQLAELIETGNNPVLAQEILARLNHQLSPIELALKQGGGPALKITAFASSSTHDELQLGFTLENLKHFATEINLAFEFEFLSFESLNSGSWPLPLHTSESEAIAVNLPIGSFSNYPLSLPLVLGFVKQLSPKIVVSLDRGCDRTDLPFPLHIIHAVQSYSGLLESLDAVNVNLDALQKIERHLLQPGIEKIVLGRRRSSDRTPPWRGLFLSSGFSPLTFSNFTESQAECLVQRTPVRGFHVEKKQTSLVLCWQRKELVSASVWRC
ncbi:hypothetical protein ACJW31_11G108900 [Castanea mollissima]